MNTGWRTADKALARLLGPPQPVPPGTLVPRREWLAWPGLDVRASDALTALALGKSLAAVRDLRERLRPELDAAALDPHTITCAGLRGIYGVGRETIGRVANALQLQGYPTVMREWRIIFGADQPEMFERARAALKKLHEADPAFLQAVLGDDELVAVRWFIAKVRGGT